MLKTNSKKVINKINNYIIDSINFEYFPELKEGANLEEIKSAILKEFITIKLKNFNCGDAFTVLERFYNNNIYEAFKDWVQGLPSSFDTLYYYNTSAIDLVGDWLEQTEEERNRYNEQEAEELASRLIFRELTKKIDIYNLIMEI